MIFYQMDQLRNKFPTLFFLLSLYYMEEDGSNSSGGKVILNSRQLVIWYVQGVESMIPNTKFLPNQAQQESLETAYFSNIGHSILEMF